jgi:drug/metabolite transporter (DMT)-like permease
MNNVGAHPLPLRGIPCPCLEIRCLAWKSWVGEWSGVGSAQCGIGTGVGSARGGRSLDPVRRSYLTLAAVCAGWGTIPLVVRNVDLPATAIVAVRLWVAAAGLGVALLVTRSGPQKGAHPALLSVKPWSCVTAGAVLAVHWITLFAAYKRAPAGTVILVVYLAPVGIAAIAPRVLGEALPARTLAALGVAVTGFALVAWPAVGAASIGGLVYAVAAAVTFVVLVLVSKPLAESYGGLRLAFMEMAGAGLLILPVAA